MDNLIDDSSFKLNDVEHKRLTKWLETKNLYKYEGTIGGRFTFHFTPTSVGMHITVSDAMEQKDTIDITDYDCW